MKCFIPVVTNDETRANWLNLQNWHNNHRVGMATITTLGSVFVPDINVNRSTVIVVTQINGSLTIPFSGTFPVTGGGGGTVTVNLNLPRSFGVFPVYGSGFLISCSDISFTGTVGYMKEDIDS